MRRTLLLLTILAGACDFVPQYVNSRDIDDAMAQGRTKVVCHGLSMPEEETRRYATQRLRTLEGDPSVGPCICANLTDDKGRLDAGVAAGLKGERDDARVGCLADLLRKPDLDKRIEAIQASASIPAPVVRQALADIATDPATPTDVRLAAFQPIKGDVAFEAKILSSLSDPDAQVRAAAAEGLAGLKSAAALDALAKAAKDDADGMVRANALVALKRAGVPEADDQLCRAMLEDESPEVRRKAVMAYQGTKRPEAIACLRKRALTEEDDAGVRDALLQVLKSSPEQAAADVLCDAIPFWMKTYVTTDLPDKIPGTNIVETQNDRDWDNSYKCLAKAMSNAGGYSCYARMHVATWFREVGGSAYVPRCPGYEDAGG